MLRRLATLTCCSTLLLAAAPAHAAGEVVGTTVLGAQAQQDSGTATSLDLVRAYQRRVVAHDGTLEAYLALSPYAQADAASRDAERAAGIRRSLLHGVPVAVKDLLDNADLPTTGGSAALAGTRAPDDAAALAALREAGAVVLGTTNLSELARSYSSASSLGGQTRNAFDPSLQPGGSSGGSAAAVAASLATVSVGTDTCGSVRVPASFTGLVGLRPTHGAVSLDGVLPLSATQDTVGALGRSAVDVALTMDALSGTDGAFTDAFGVVSLEGARLGVWVPARDAADARVRAAFDRAVADLRAGGAEVVEVTSAAVAEAAPRSSVILYESQQDLEAYLAQPGRVLPAGLAARTAPADRVTVSDLLADGRVTADARRSLEAGQQVDRSSPGYADRLAHRSELQASLDAVFAEHDLDAVVQPTTLTGAAPVGTQQSGTSTCQLAAHSGRPAVTVPMAGADGGSPLGLELLGRPDEDTLLLALADDYESATGHGQPAPGFPELPPLPSCSGSEPQPFSDAGGSVHGEAIACAASHGIATGRADGTFRPAAAVTRGQFASLLARGLAAAHVALPDGPDAFDDDAGSAHEAALDALAALGVMTGTGPRQASPDAPLPRAQAVALVSRAYGVLYGVAPHGRVDTFFDDDGLAVEAAADGLAAIGVVQGRDGALRPAEVVTRGQMTSLVVRAFVTG